MPTACGAPVKYMWVHHDSAYLHQVGVVQDQWYTVLEDDDVRILWIVVNRINDETDTRSVDVRATLDGTPFLVRFNADYATAYWIYRDYWDFAVWGAGLVQTASEFNAARYADLRAHECKIEVRMHNAPGTNPVLDAWVVYETLEQVPP